MKGQGVTKVLKKVAAVKMQEHVVPYSLKQEHH